MRSQVWAVLLWALGGGFVSVTAADEHSLSNVKFLSTDGQGTDTMSGAGIVRDELILNTDLARNLLKLPGREVPKSMQVQDEMSLLDGKPGRESFLYE